MAAEPVHRDRRRGATDLRGRLRHLRSWERHLPGGGSRTCSGPPPHMAGAQRAVDGPGGGGLCQGHARSTDHDRHLVDRPRLHQHGDRRRGGPRQPASGPDLLGRHLPAPDRRPGAPAGRSVRGSDDHRLRHLQAREPLLGPNNASRTGGEVSATGAGGDAGPGQPRTGLLRPPPGCAGRGLRLPPPVSSSTRFITSADPEPTTATSSGQPRR